MYRACHRIPHIRHTQNVSLTPSSMYSINYILHDSPRLDSFYLSNCHIYFSAIDAVCKNISEQDLISALYRTNLSSLLFSIINLYFLGTSAVLRESTIRYCEIGAVRSSKVFTFYIPAPHLSYIET